MSRAYLAFVRDLSSGVIVPSDVLREVTQRARAESPRQRFRWCRRTTGARGDLIQRIQPRRAEYGVGDVGIRRHGAQLVCEGIECELAPTE